MASDRKPSTWQWKPIAELVAPKETWSPSKQPRKSFRYVDISSIDNEAGCIREARSIDGGDAPSRARKVIRSGDVLFATTRPYLKNIAVVPSELDGEICSTGFCVLRPMIGKVLTPWLFYVARSDLVVDQVVPNQDKSTYPAVSDGEVLGSQIPVPPLDEQRRLVANIEEITTKLHEVHRLHGQAMVETAGLFQAGLNMAFGPKAVAEWTTHRTDRLFTVVKGQVDPREAPYVDMPHVGPDSIESGTARLLPDTVQTPRQLGLKSGKYLFGPVHVLYSKIRPALRKVALPDFAGMCSADMYPLLPNTDLISREFLALSLLAPAFSRYAVENSDRNAMPKINRTVLFAYEMPVPDRDTQTAIAKELFGLKEKAENLAALQTEMDAELRAFMPALLAKAFRGEL